MLLITLQPPAIFKNAANGSEQLTVIDNGLIKITFSNKGAQLKSVELKNYKSYDSTNVVLGGSAFDNISYTINTSPSQSAPTSSLYFNPPVIKKEPDGRQIISYNLSSPDGQDITHQFVVKQNDYIVDWNIILNGANKLLTGNSLNLNWQVQARKQQSDIIYERRQSRLCYVEDGSYDFKNAATGAT
ncbi:MAG: YidC/Oxa1 family insertase periplasmic-domain containing protein [Segetibacter sp.]